MQSQRSGGGPRPVRTAASPWAKAGLTRSETQAVSLANSLLAATLWWFAELLVSGGAAIIEHPACWEERAAIWRLPAVRALQRSKDVQLVTFDQCMFGSPARAPTSLLCLRAPLVAATMDGMGGRGRCTHGWGAHESLTGKDERGVWRTARKRAYRPPLCHLMADALLAGLGGPEVMVGDTTDDQAKAELPDGLRPFAQELPEGAPEAADDAYADLDGAGSSGAASRADRRQEVWRRRREREVSRAAASDAFIAALMQEEPSLAPEGAAGQCIARATGVGPAAGQCIARATGVGPPAGQCIARGPAAGQCIARAAGVGPPAGQCIARGPPAGQCIARATGVGAAAGQCIARGPAAGQCIARATSGGADFSPAGSGEPSDRSGSTAAFA